MGIEIWCFLLHRFSGETTLFWPKSRGGSPLPRVWELIIPTHQLTSWLLTSAASSFTFSPALTGALKTPALQLSWLISVIETVAAAVTASVLCLSVPFRSSWSSISWSGPTITTCIMITCGAHTLHHRCQPLPLVALTGEGPPMLPSSALCLFVLGLSSCFALVLVWASVSVCIVNASILICSQSPWSTLSWVISPM